MVTISIAHLRIASPYDALSIEWEVDGFSGSTQCEAWRLQHEIECLEVAGYSIKMVRKA